MSADFDAVAQAVSSKPNFYNEIIKNCVDKQPNYKVYVELGNSRLQYIGDISDALEELSNRESY